MQHGVIGDRFVEGLPLLAIREFAIEQQVADLHEIAILRQILDPVAPVHEDPFVAIQAQGYWFYIDERDLDSLGTFTLLQDLYSIEVLR